MIGPEDPTKDKTRGGGLANRLWLDWLACETIETKSTLVGTTNQSIEENQTTLSLRLIG